MMSSSVDSLFQEFYQFCSTVLADENPKFLDLIQRRYDECDKDFRRSQSLADLLIQTKSKIENERSRLFVHLRDFNDTLKVNRRTKKKNDKKRKRSSNETEFDIKPKLCKIVLERADDIHNCHSTPDCKDDCEGNEAKRQKIQSCFLGDGDIDKAKIIRDCTDEGNMRLESEDILCADDEGNSKQWNSLSPNTSNPTLSPRDDLPDGMPSSLPCNPRRIHISHPVPVVTVTQSESIIRVLKSSCKGSTGSKLSRSNSGDGVFKGDGHTDDKYVSPDKDKDTFSLADGVVSMVNRLLDKLGDEEELKGENDLISSQSVAGTSVDILDPSGANFLENGELYCAEENETLNKKSGNEESLTRDKELTRIEQNDNENEVCDKELHISSILDDDNGEIVEKNMLCSVSNDSSADCFDKNKMNKSSMQMKSKDGDGSDISNDGREHSTVKISSPSNTSSLLRVTDNSDLDLEQDSSDLVTVHDSDNTGKHSDVGHIAADSLSLCENDDILCSDDPCAIDKTVEKKSIPPSSGPEGRDNTPLPVDVEIHSPADLSDKDCAIVSDLGMSCVVNDMDNEKSSQGNNKVLPESDDCNDSNLSQPSPDCNIIESLSSNLCSIVNKSDVDVQEKDQLCDTVGDSDANGSSSPRTKSSKNGSKDLKSDKCLKEDLHKESISNDEDKKITLESDKSASLNNVVELNGEDGDEILFIENSVGESEGKKMSLEVKDTGSDRSKEDGNLASNAEDSKSNSKDKDTGSPVKKNATDGKITRRRLPLIKLDAISDGASKLNFFGGLSLTPKGGCEGQVADKHKTEAMTAHPCHMTEKKMNDSRVDKVTSLKDADKEANSADEFAPDTTSNFKRVVAGAMAKGKKPPSERHIKKLEQLLEKLRDEIEKGREMTLDELDQENSFYIYEDKLKKKFVAAWNKLCEITSRTVTTGRPTERTIHYEGTRYKEINRRLQKFLNRRKMFPDFQDVKTIIKLTNKKCNLHLNAQMVNDMAREAFVDIGEMLQTRRHQDFIATFGSRQTDDYSAQCDPAFDDPELRRKLESNRKMARSNLDAVIQKYTQLQYKKGVADDDDDDDNDEEEEEEEENGIDRSKSENVKHKKRHKMKDKEKEKKRRYVASSEDEEEDEKGKDKGEPAPCEIDMDVTDEGTGTGIRERDRSLSPLDGASPVCGGVAARSDGKDGSSNQHENFDPGTSSKSNTTPNIKFTKRKPFPVISTEDRASPYLDSPLDSPSVDSPSVDSPSVDSPSVGSPMEVDFDAKRNGALMNLKTYTNLELEDETSQSEDNKEDDDNDNGNKDDDDDDLDVLVVSPENSDDESSSSSKCASPVSVISLGSSSDDECDQKPSSVETDLKPFINQLYMALKLPELSASPRQNDETSNEAQHKDGGSVVLHNQTQKTTVEITNVHSVTTALPATPKKMLDSVEDVIVILDTPDKKSSVCENDVNVRKGEGIDGGLESYSSVGEKKNVVTGVCDDGDGKNGNDDNNDDGDAICVIMDVRTESDQVHWKQDAWGSRSKDNDGSQSRQIKSKDFGDKEMRKGENEDGRRNKRTESVEVVGVSDGEEEVGGGGVGKMDDGRSVASTVDDSSVEKEDGDEKEEDVDADVIVLSGSEEVAEKKTIGPEGEGERSKDEMEKSKSDALGREDGESVKMSSPGLGMDPAELEGNCKKVGRGQEEESDGQSVVGRIQSVVGAEGDKDGTTLLDDEDVMIVEKECCEGEQEVKEEKKKKKKEDEEGGGGDGEKERMGRREEKTDVGEMIKDVGVGEGVVVSGKDGGVEDEVEGMAVSGKDGGVEDEGEGVVVSGKDGGVEDEGEGAGCDRHCEPSGGGGDVISVDDDDEEDVEDGDLNKEKEKRDGDVGSEGGVGRKMDGVKEVAGDDVEGVMVSAVDGEKTESGLVDGGSVDGEKTESGLVDGGSVEGESGEADGVERKDEGKDDDGGDDRGDGSTKGDEDVVENLIGRKEEEDGGKEGKVEEEDSECVLLVSKDGEKSLQEVEKVKENEGNELKGRKDDVDGEKDEEKDGVKGVESKSDKSSKNEDGESEKKMGSDEKVAESSEDWKVGESDDFEVYMDRGDDEEDEEDVLNCIAKLCDSIIQGDDGDDDNNDDDENRRDKDSKNGEEERSEVEGDEASGDDSGADKKVKETEEEDGQKTKTSKGGKVDDVEKSDEETVDVDKDEEEEEEKPVRKVRKCTRSKEEDRKLVDELMRNALEVNVTKNLTGKRKSEKMETLKCDENTDKNMDDDLEITNVESAPPAAKKSKIVINPSFPKTNNQNIGNRVQSVKIAPKVAKPGFSSTSSLPYHSKPTSIHPPSSLTTQHGIRFGGGGKGPTMSLPRGKLDPAKTSSPNNSKPSGGVNWDLIRASLPPIPPPVKSGNLNKPNPMTNSSFPRHPKPIGPSTLPPPLRPTHRAMPQPHTIQPHHRMGAQSMLHNGRGRTNIHGVSGQRLTAGGQDVKFHRGHQPHSRQLAANQGHPGSRHSSIPTLGPRVPIPRIPSQHSPKFPGNIKLSPGAGSFSPRIPSPRPNSSAPMPRFRHGAPVTRGRPRGSFIQARVQERNAFVAAQQKKMDGLVMVLDDSDEDDNSKDTTSPPVSGQTTTTKSPSAGNSSSQSPPKKTSPGKKGTPGDATIVLSDSE